MAQNNKIEKYIKDLGNNGHLIISQDAQKGLMGDEAD